MRFSNMHRRLCLAAALYILLLHSCERQFGCTELLSDRDLEYVDRVNEMMKAGRLTEAIRTNNEALQHNPQNYMAISNRGALLFEQKGHRVDRKELGLIIEDLEYALAICPEYLPGSTNLMTIASEFQLSNQVIAAAWLRDSLVGLSDYHRTKLLIGYYHLGEYALAARVGESVIASQPDYREAANYLGLTYLQLGAYEKSEDLLTVFVRNGYADGLTYRALGQLSMIRGDTSHAVRHLRSSIRLNAREFTAYLELAGICEATGDTASACSYYLRMDSTCKDLFHYRYGRPAVRERLTQLCGVQE